MQHRSLLAVTFLLGALDAQSLVWSKAAVLDARSGQAMVYDTTRHLAVLFGGFQTARYDETWEWDGVGWTLRNPAVRPAGRRDHAMAYDSTRQRVVMFGGNGASGGLADTWEWDGNAWTQFTPATSPSPRDGAMMAHDAARGVTLLYGGQGLAALADTWQWNGTQWTQLAPAASPGLRELGAMVDDGSRQRIVLFGGTTGAANQSDTWEWDGVTWSLVPTANQPPARQRHGLAWDSLQGRTVLFGGNAGSLRFNDVWTYDGTNWVQAATPALVPAARDRVAMTFDPDRARVVVFGGRGPTSTNNLADTWEWDGAAWWQRGATLQPAARSAPALAFDTASSAVLLFGGQGATARLQDTWQWDGAQWTPRAPATLPPARSGHALAWDSSRQRAVLFAGLDATGSALGDTWEWDGSNWLAQSPAVQPVQRSGHALAFDAGRGRTVLFGGLFGFAAVALNDTWEWDGAQWLQSAPATLPAARTAHALAFDAARGRTVLFGGSTVAPATALGDTWEWDGVQWTQDAPATAPAARSGHALGYDGARTRTVLFGGTDAGGALQNDTWEWNGTLWSQTASTGPAARSGLALAGDGVRRRIVLFGGTLAAGTSGETWEYGLDQGADVTPFGGGCPGTSGVPVLAATGAPSLGNGAFALRLSALVPGAFDLLALGSGRTQLDLGSGCTLYLAGAIGIAGSIADGGGASTFPIPVPPSLGLLGTRLYAQGAGVDPNGAFFGQLALSRALDVRVGQ